MTTQKQANKGVNVLNDPEERKKFKSLLNDIVAQYQMIDDRRECIKEAISEMSDDYGIDKKHIRKLAVTIHKANYSEQRKSNQAFEAFYELIIEGGLRNDEVEVDLGDPLDREEIEGDSE